MRVRCEGATQVRLPYNVVADYLWEIAHVALTFRVRTIGRRLSMHSPLETSV